MVIILLFLTTISLIIEVIRNHYNGYFRYIFQEKFSSILRKTEMQGKLTGATWMLIGFTFTVLLFEIEIAVLALLFLSVGDSIAAIVGKIFPIGKIWNKSILGSFAGIILCVFSGIIINDSVPQIIIILGAISAMSIELIPSRINDNFSIPVFSGFIMQIFKEAL
tara:strand:- start:346 stop:840 length:495 start_codon:yes stop_codon:yes gene_type:complete